MDFQNGQNVDFNALRTASVGQSKSKLSASDLNRIKDDLGVDEFGEIGRFEEVVAKAVDALLEIEDPNAFNLGAPEITLAQQQQQQKPQPRLDGFEPLDNEFI